MTCRTKLVALAIMLGASPALGTELKAEMIVQFTKGGVACLERDHLQELTMYAMSGEKTKTNAMMIDHGGDCVMLSPNRRFKILHAEYNNPDLDIGIVEIVGEDKVSRHVAWAFSVGAEPVQAKAPTRRR